MKISQLLTDVHAILNNFCAANLDHASTSFRFHNTFFSLQTTRFDNKPFEDRPRKYFSVINTEEFSSLPSSGRHYQHSNPVF